MLDEVGGEQARSGEARIREKLGADEDTAFAVSHRRTLQEPMARMMMCDSLLYAFDELLPTLESVANVADEDADVIVAGHNGGDMRGCRKVLRPRRVIVWSAGRYAAAWARTPHSLGLAACVSRTD